MGGGRGASCRKLKTYTQISDNYYRHIQTNLCIHLSYLEDQRNMKIYNIKKKIKKIKKNKNFDNQSDNQVTK